jgi:predicted DNA-binding transcriptional regulator AlpA
MALPATRQRERCNLTSVAEALPRDWWTTRDVAAFLNVSPSTIRAYVARGQMPAADRRIGREPVWRPATIRKWHSQRPRLAGSDTETNG